MLEYGEAYLESCEQALAQLKKQLGPEAFSVALTLGPQDALTSEPSMPQ